MKKKRLIAAILAVMLAVMLLPAAAFAKTLNDVEAHWARGEIQKWTDNGVLSGYPDDTFRPDAFIKRGELFKIVNEVFNYQEVDMNRFADLKASDWYYDVALKLVAAGVVYGDGNRINGDDYITREQVFAILARAFDIPTNESGLVRFIDGSDVSPWFVGEIGGLAAAGYVIGTNGKLNPKVNITRAEVVKTLDNIVGGFFNEAGTYDNVAAGIVVVNTSGVVLTNANITNLYITQGVGNGDFTLKDSSVTGTMFINGGGSDSIHIIGSHVDAVDLNVSVVNGEVRVEATDGSVVEVIYIEDGSDDVILEGNFGDVVINGNVKTEVASGSDVGKIDIVGGGAEIVVEEGANVKLITVNADNTGISGAGTVKSVNVESGYGTSVSVVGAEVTVAEAAGEVTTSSGTIEPGTKDTVTVKEEATKGGGSTTGSWAPSIKTANAEGNHSSVHVKVESSATESAQTINVTGDLLYDYNVFRGTARADLDCGILDSYGRTIATTIAGITDYQYTALTINNFKALLTQAGVAAGDTITITQKNKALAIYNDTDMYPNNTKTKQYDFNSITDPFVMLLLPDETATLVVTNADDATILTLTINTNGLKIGGPIIRAAPTVLNAPITAAIASGATANAQKIIVSGDISHAANVFTAHFAADFDSVIDYSTKQPLRTRLGGAFTALGITNFDALLTQAGVSSSNVITIKQTNDALRMYTSDEDTRIVDNVKTSTYTASTFDSDNHLNVLLLGHSQVMIEVFIGDPVTTGTPALTITIDTSGLNVEGAPAP